MGTSAFSDKNQPPAETEFRTTLGKSVDLWDAIVTYVQSLGDHQLEWKHYGRKIGWLRKVLLNKRNLFFVVPRDGHFSVSFTFGQNAVDQVLHSAISESVKAALRTSRTYAEGQTVMFDLLDHASLKEARLMIDIKLRN